MATSIPIVLACSGCSYAGQLTNDVAIELDRRGSAEMSCLAGFGAAKPSFLRKARRQSIWVIDGCPIECGKGIMDRVELTILRHIRLHDLGIPKLHPPETPLTLQQLAERIENDRVAPEPETT